MEIDLVDYKVLYQIIRNHKECGSVLHSFDFSQTFALS